MVQIIARSRWGARYARGFTSAPLPASEVWLHHSVTIAPNLVWVDADRDGVEDDEERAMRTLEDIGQSRFGGGISYTFAVMPSGRIYEGHGVDRQGAHTGGRNSIARAIVLVGDYSRQAMTEAQMRAVAALLQHGRAAGWWKAARLNGGHRQAPGASTACPGDAAFAAIPRINQLAAGGPIEEVDELSARAEKLIADIHEVLISGITTDSRYNRDLAYIVGKVDGVGKQVTGAISAQEARVLAAIAADGTHPVDVHELSDALVTQLGPDLGEALLDALAAQLNLNRNREGN